MIKIVDGDFGANATAVLCRSTFGQRIKEIAIITGLFASPIRIPPGQILRVEKVSDRAAVSAGGLIAGAIAFGAVGAIVGGRSTATGFMVTLRDGRQFLAEGSTQDYLAFHGLTVGSYPSTKRKRPSTPLHLALTVLTCGLWLPVWLIAAARS